MNHWGGKAGHWVLMATSPQVKNSLCCEHSFIKAKACLGIFINQVCPPKHKAAGMKQTAAVWRICLSLQSVRETVWIICITSFFFFFFYKLSSCLCVWAQAGIPPRLYSSPVLRDPGKVSGSTMIITTIKYWRWMNEGWMNGWDWIPVYKSPPPVVMSSAAVQKRFVARNWVGQSGWPSLPCLSHPVWRHTAWTCRPNAGHFQTSAADTYIHTHIEEMGMWAPSIYTGQSFKIQSFNIAF